MKKRLLEIVDYLEISVRNFEVACGLGRGNISNMTDESAIGSDKLAKIIDTFPYFNSEWILTGSGSMIKDNIDLSSLKKGEGFKYLYTSQDISNFLKSNSSADEQPDHFPDVRKMIPSNNGIPLISTSAMAGVFAGETVVLDYECDRYIIPAFKDAEFLISVKGSSMIPKYNSGDIVACKRMPVDTFFQWNKVYVLDTEQGALIKRIKKGTNDDVLTICSDNPNYEPFELHRSKIYNIAMVVGVIRLE